jgi:hypothetical protein
MADHETTPQEMAETDVNAAINEINLFLRRHALAYSDAAPSAAQQCHWCYDNFLIGTPIPLPCGHIFCRQCLNACFRTGMANRRSFPPSCCAQPIEFASIVGHLDQPVALRYTQKQAEYSIKDPTWCSHKPCSKLFTQPQIDGARERESAKFMVCDDCRCDTCFRCKQGREMHRGPKHTRCPKQAGITKKDRALARDEKWKLCPNPQCSVLIIKSEACNHMMYVGNLAAKMIY